MIIKKGNIIFLIFLLIAINCKSQVVINEYSCSNVSTSADNYGSFEDWIELYNTSGVAVNLAGYYLSDKATNPTKWQFPAGISIAANGRLTIFCSGNDIVVGTNIHTNFKLTQTKPESIVFSNSTATILENIVLLPTQKNHSRGRQTDGAASWSLFLTPTFGTVNSGAVQEYVATPVFSQQAGFNAAAVTLTISCATPGSTIRYTIDGTEPTAASTVYSGALNIAATTVVRAKAFSATPGVPPSFIQSNTYFINVSHSIATLSVYGNNVNTLFGGTSMEPDAAIEYFDKTNQFRVEATGVVNKHGNDSWAYDQRGIDFVTKDQQGYDYALRYNLFNYKNRNEYQRIIIKALANDNYPFENGGAHIRDPYVSTLSQRGELFLDERTYEPCVLYVNGQYWGLYDMREKVDDADFTDFYYNSDEKGVQMLKTWGGTWSEYGGAQAQTDWDNLMNYILTNNMAVAANYNYVENLYNTKSLVDYFILNSYVVCSDWLNWNTEWWRGINPNADKKKWRYCLWDEDATFGHYINYTGIPDQSAQADPCNPEQLGDQGGQGHVPILNSLLNNQTFRQYYVSRYADLSNTVFSCVNMQFVLDSLIALSAPEMPRQIARWGGNLAQWQANVQTLKTFIDTRCAAMSQGMVDCYNLTGPYNINFQVDPPNTGIINVNSILVPTYPWNAIYYGNIETILQATATAPNYTFDYWELVDPVTPNTTADSVNTTFTGSQTVIAHFKTTIPPIVVTGVPTNSPCYGDNVGSIDITVSGGTTATGTFNYIWSNGATTQDIYFLVPGNYSVTVTDDSAGVEVASFVITQPSQLGLTTSPDLQLCIGASANINAYPTGDTPPYYYQWSNGNITSGFTVSPLSDITYFVTVTGSNGCPGKIDSVHVIVSSGVDLTLIANKYNICPYETVQLSVSMSGGGGPPYLVYNSSGAIVTPPIFINPILTGFQFLYVQDGCGSIAHDSVLITVNPNPNPAFVSNINEGCEPLTVTFNPVSAVAGQTYSWNFGDLNYNSVSFNTNPTHEFSHDGIFDVTLTVTSSSGCDSTKVFADMINVFNTPEARFIANPNIVSIVKPQIIFANLSEYALTYMWSFGDGDSSSITNPMHWYQMLGEYNVKLIAVSDKGCKDTVNSSIVIRDEYTFYTPNAITPDGDKNNDVFYVMGNEISAKNFHLYILDRWGGVIFETDKYDKDQPAKYGWNGSLKDGSTVSIGSYTWFVKYLDGDGIEHDKSGVINVIR